MKKSDTVECLRCFKQFDSWDKTKNRICPTCKRRGVEYEECLMDDVYWNELEDFNIILDEDYWDFVHDK